MITERIYIKSQGLAEIHEQLARMEEAGWSKASPLMYTHDEHGQGWEIAVHREVEEIDDCPAAFSRFFDGFVRGCIILVVAAASTVATVSVVRWIW